MTRLGFQTRILNSGLFTRKIPSIHYSLGISCWIIYVSLPSSVQYKSILEFYTEVCYLIYHHITKLLTHLEILNSETETTDIIKKSALT